MDNIYYQKYLKYKSKYLELQKISGGKLSPEIEEIKKIMDEYENQPDTKNRIKNAIIRTQNQYSEYTKIFPKDNKLIGTNDDYQILRYKFFILVKNNDDIHEYYRRGITERYFSFISHYICDKVLELDFVEIKKLSKLEPIEIKKMLILELTEIKQMLRLEPIVIKQMLELKPTTDRNPFRRRY